MKIIKLYLFYNTQTVKYKMLYMVSNYYYNYNNNNNNQKYTVRTIDYKMFYTGKISQMLYIGSIYF